MGTITIDIIDTNLENNLLSFKVNGEKIFCIDKTYSNTLKEFIKNVFVIAIAEITQNKSKNQFNITNIDNFDDNPISYDDMNGVTYKIEYIEEEVKYINYEIEL